MQTARCIWDALASLLPGDFLARYFRLKGDQVLYVSGSDCHGTPVAVQANQEGVSPGAIADRYHQEFADCFKKLGFSYDLYTRTDREFHHHEVQDLFSKLLNNGYLYKKTINQIYCETDKQFLPDRYVEGNCPVCGNRARGDLCDYCSTLLDPADLTDRTCKICGNPPTSRPTEHFYFSLSRFQDELAEYSDKARGWRENAVQLTKRYLKEGSHPHLARTAYGSRGLPSSGPDIVMRICDPGGEKVFNQPQLGGMGSGYAETLSS